MNNTRNRWIGPTLLYHYVSGIWLTEIIVKIVKLSPRSRFSLQKVYNRKQQQKYYKNSCCSQRCQSFPRYKNRLYLSTFDRHIPSQARSLWKPHKTTMALTRFIQKNRYPQKNIFKLKELSIFSFFYRVIRVLLVEIIVI
jgi:hypothetical protein